MEAEQPEIVVLRFARVMFGVSASPFLLNATIAHHMQRYQVDDGSFVEQFLRSIYVDDFTTGSDSVEKTYEFYKKSKLHLAEVKFNLRKFHTNSPSLHQKIAENEGELLENDCVVSENGLKKTQSLDNKKLQEEVQVLGVKWNCVLSCL